MSTDEQISRLIRSYRFTVIMGTGVILLSFVILTYTLLVMVPGALTVALDEYYSTHELQVAE